MGDPAGELADSLHLLRLLEQKAELVAIGDVHEAADDPSDGAVGVSERDPAVPDEAIRAVTRAKPITRLGRAGFELRPRDDLRDLGAVVRVNLLQEPSVARSSQVDAVLERGRQTLGPVRLSRRGVPLVDCAVERPCSALESLVRLAERGVDRSPSLGVAQRRHRRCMLGEEECKPPDDEQRRQHPGHDDDGEIDRIAGT